MMVKRLRMMALVLLFATLLSVFGCAGAKGESDISDAAGAAPNFIGSKSYALNTTRSEARPETLLNLAATDAAGAPLFQIVYKLGASEWQIEECNRLSDVIFDVTGVRVPVVHSMEKQKEHEIVVGDVPRTELLDIKDSVSLGAVDFLIKTVGTRVMIFSRNDMAVTSAVTYFTDTIAYRNAGAKEFGIASDFELLQVGVGDQKIELLSVDEHYVEMKVPYTVSISSFVRLSYTGMTGWRIQTKFNEADAYDDFGASQWLARSLGEAEPSALEKITVREVGGVWVAEAADGSCAEIDANYLMSSLTPANATKKMDELFFTSPFAASVENVATIHYLTDDGFCDMNDPSFVNLSADGAIVTSLKFLDRMTVIPSHTSGGLYLSVNDLGEVVYLNREGKTVGSYHPAALRENGGSFGAYLYTASAIYTVTGELVYNLQNNHATVLPMVHSALILSGKDSTQTLSLFDNGEMRSIGTVGGSAPTLDYYAVKDDLFVLHSIGGKYSYYSTSGTLLGESEHLLRDCAETIKGYLYTDDVTGTFYHFTFSSH